MKKIFKKSKIRIKEFIEFEDSLINAIDDIIKHFENTQNKECTICMPLANEKIENEIQKKRLENLFKFIFNNQKIKHRLRITIYNHQTDEKKIIFKYSQIQKHLNKIFKQFLLTDDSDEKYMRIFLDFKSIINSKKIEVLLTYDANDYFSVEEYISWIPFDKIKNLCDKMDELGEEKLEEFTQKVKKSKTLKI